MTVGFGHGIAVTRCTSPPATRRSSTAASITLQHLLKVPPPSCAARRSRLLGDTIFELARSSAWSSPRAPAEGRCARLSVGGKTALRKAHRRPLQLGGGGHEFRGSVPDGRAPLCDVMMLDDPKATARPTASTPPRGISAPAFGVAVSRIAPLLGVQPDREPRTGHEPSCRLSFTKNTQGITG